MCVCVDSEVQNKHMYLFKYIPYVHSNLVGYAYPAFKSFKCIQNGQKEKYPEWLMYWYVW